MKERAYLRSLQNRRSSGPPPKDTTTNRRPGARSATSDTGQRQQEALEQVHQRIAPHVAALEDATASLRDVFGSKGRSTDAEFKAVCKNLVVGRATSTSCSPVSVYRDRLEYKFRHTSHGCVQMLMWLKDMSEVELDMATLTLSFHIGRPLRHFGTEYDPASRDRLSMQFCSREEAEAFAQRCSELLTAGGGRH